MAAIQLDRLQSQLNELMWKFNQPDEFLDGLRELLEYYSDRTFRSGVTNPSPKTIRTYRVPPIFLIQLNNVLHTRCKENPVAALSLADALWKDASFEIRQTAIEILANNPVDKSEETILRINQWCQPGEDGELIWSLLHLGAGNLRKQKAQDWLMLIQSWLASPDDFSKITGLKAALATIRDDGFLDLPSLYNQLMPILTQAPISLQPELIEILKALAIRSPAEVLFLLRQALILGDESNIIRLVRKLIPGLDAVNAKQVRMILEETQRIRQ